MRSIVACLSVAMAIPTKTAEPIEMPLGY